MNSETFSANNIQCKLPALENDSSRDQCKRFIQKFSEFTNTNWIVKRSPAVQRLEFRKQYGCQHSSFNKKHEKRNRNFQCSATINIKFKKNNRNTIKNDVLLKDGMNVIIEINFNHSHRIHVASAYKFLRCDPDVQKQFEMYFEQGMTPTIAQQYHEINILDSADDQVLANAQKNPTNRKIRYLYDKWRKINLGGRSDRDVVTVLKERQNIFSENGVYLTIKRNPMIIAIITPIMKRLFLNEYADEMVYIDSSGSCDQTSTRVTFIFASLKIGAVPIACVLHTADTKANYTLAFMAAKEALENDTTKKIQPVVIMTDDADAERNALKCLFSRATLLLCHFHVCQAVWRWLWLSDHKVEKDFRKVVMKSFQNVLYAESEETATAFFSDLIKDVKDNAMLKNYMINLWERRAEWCLCYRSDLMTRGNCYLCCYNK